MLLKAALSLLAAAGTALAQSACNGQAAFCDRLWSEISLIGTHDSPFVGDALTDDQGVSVADQLADGIRMLQAQTRWWSQELRMCHTSCDLRDAGSLVDYMGVIGTFLADNPDEVITLLLTNPDSVTMDHFAASFVAPGANGVTDYVYTPSGQNTISEWPTLRELIAANDRLIVFLDYGADVTTVPYILDEFLYFFETPYDVTDSSFSSCAIDRPAGASATGRMYLVNHYLDVDILGILLPDVAADATTNSAASIEGHANRCKALYGSYPNIVLVDRFLAGDVFAAQLYMNGL